MRLTTVFALAPGARISLIPDSQLRADGPVDVVKSSNCETVTNLQQKVARIYALPPPSSAFQDGWNKLPTELQVEIISWTVGCESVPIPPESVSFASHFDRVIMPWASVSPELGALAK